MSSGPDRYVRVAGRLDAEDEFEDDAHRPLVLRRTRLLLREGRAWRAIEDRREAVPFWVRDGLDAIAIDADALDAGLVVIPRESVGTAADAPDRLPAGTDPATPLRLLVEQVSSIEHAVVLGVPTPGPDGMPRMTAGLGRPLVLTTLERTRRCACWRGRALADPWSPPSAWREGSSSSAWRWPGPWCEAIL